MRFLLILLLLSGLLPRPALAAPDWNESLDLQYASEQISVSRFLYLEDAERKLTLEEALQKDGWQLNDRPSFSFGFAKADYWITFKVKNTEPVPRDWILELQGGPSRRS
jgi:hypothetical protein